MFKALLLAPVPPPDHGGIINWTRIIRRELSSWPDISLSFVDSKPWYRKTVAPSLWLRLAGGTAQAIRDFFRVTGRLKTERPDLLHVCTSGGPATPKDVLILHAARSIGVPSVIHYRMGRLPEIVARSGLEWRLTRRAIELAHATIVLDRESLRVLRMALPQSRVVQLPNMVEVDVVDGILRKTKYAEVTGNQSARLVYVGHVTPQKGLRELVQSCTELVSHSVCLDIVGPVTSRFREELEAIAATRENRGWLRFLGTLEHNQALHHIATADLFVLPSYSEGAPNVVLEAMACGKPIVATTVGSVSEMLDAGGLQECGVCVPPRDAQALRGGIASMLGNLEHRNELGRRARERVERIYAAPVACRQLVDLWRSVAGNSDHALLRTSAA